MKKLYSLTIAIGLGLTFSPSLASASENILSVDVAKVCDVKANGIKTVLATAAKYNKIAKKHGVEFKRLGMTNTQYIDETNKALKAGQKKIKLLDKKGKVDKKLPAVTVEYAAHRACKFAISALTQEAEGKTSWRLAVPGDGYKY